MSCLVISHVPSLALAWFMELQMHLTSGYIFPLFSIYCFVLLDQATLSIGLLKTNLRSLLLICLEHFSSFGEIAFNSRILLKKFRGRWLPLNPSIWVRCIFWIPAQSCLTISWGLIILYWNVCLLDHLPEPIICVKVEFGLFLNLIWSWHTRIYNKYTFTELNKYTQCKSEHKTSPYKLGGYMTHFKTVRSSSLMGERVM